MRRGYCILCGGRLWWWQFPITQNKPYTNIYGGRPGIHGCSRVTAQVLGKGGSTPPSPILFTEGEHGETVVEGRV